MMISEAKMIDKSIKYYERSIILILSSRQDSSIFLIITVIIKVHSLIESSKRIMRLFNHNVTKILEREMHRIVREMK